MRGKSSRAATFAAAILFLCGCDGGAPEGAATPVLPMPSPSVTSAAEPSPAPEAFAEKIKEEAAGGHWSFAYAWPQAVSAAPELAAHLGAEQAAMRQSERLAWQEAREDMPEDCASCRSRGYDKQWSVVADLPRYLSLSAKVSTYTGGAHGGLTFDALVWDREEARAIAPIAMFRSAQAVDAAVREAFCAALDKARTRKRGRFERREGNPFDGCIDPVANSIVILGSKGGQRFDRVGFLIPPYNAGPWAEGSYEVSLPMTPALIDAVRPEFRRAFLVP